MASRVPEEVYFGAKLAAALGGKAGAVCATAKQLIADHPTDLAAVGYGLGALKEGGCDVSLGTAQAAATATLKSGWNTDGGLFQGKFLTLLADTALGGGKILENVESAVKNLNKHRSEEGFMRASLDDKVGGSTDGTFLVLELVAATKVTSKGVKKTLEKAQQLLPGGGLGSGDVGADATLLPAVVKALAALGEAGLSLDAAQGQVLAAKLLKMKGTSSAKGAYKVWTGLQTLATAFPAAVPVAVVLATPVVKPNEAFKVEVKTILGKAAAPASGVVLEKVGAPLQGSGAEIGVYAGKSLKAVGSAGTFEGSTSELGAGLYDLVLQVGEKGGIKRSLIIKASGAVTDVEVGVSPTRVALDGKTYTVPLRDGQVKASALEGQYVSATFTVASPAPPQQAFLKFTHSGSGAEALYAAKRGGSAGAWKFSATVGLAEEVETAFAHRSGEYQLSLLVGDVSLEAPVEQGLGPLVLTFPSAPKVHYALYRRPLLWESDNALSAMPEIHHQFRQPERRPNPVIPAFFTLLIVLALVSFLLYLPRVGANLEGLPGGMDFVWNMAWLGCLTAVLLLFTAYWVYLKGMTTLKLLGPVGVVTVLVGHQAFSGKYKKPAGGSSL